MFELRDYQKEAADAAIKFFSSKTKKNSIIVLPTGSGKSLVIADIAARLDAPVLIFQPSKEILEQNFTKLCSYGVFDVGIYSASLNRKQVRGVTFATIGSVINNPDFFHRFKYVIVDECHLVNAEEGMYKQFFGLIECKVLGLTATPYRLHSNSYGSILRFLTRTRPKVFSEVIYHSQVGDLLQRGYLANMNYYPMDIIDTDELKLNSTGADYTDRSVRAHYRKINFNDKLEGIVERLLNAGRSSILVFTRFVEEAEYLVSIIGDKAAVVSADTPKKEREAILRRFKSGDIAVVANVGVLTTGFDFPELETVVLARPTMSLALYYQMCGRAIRPCKNKTSWIVDLGGNYSRFGKMEELVMRKDEKGLWAIYSGKKQLTNVSF